MKIKILSRHPSHRILRKNLPQVNRRVVIRFGSTTEVEDNYIEINTISAIKTSANKKLMKEAFNKAGVNTSPWVSGNSPDDVLSKLNNNNIKFPVVAKSFFGSRGIGNTLLKTAEDFKSWTNNKIVTGYIFEKYMPYALEYRLHITKDGCFYTCRKALKKDTPEKDKWRRHKDNSVWLLEENPNFFKPNSWDKIIEDCVKALSVIGADVLSFDVRVQSAKDKDGNDREFQNYIIIECNSASSLNSDNEISICAQKYLEMLPKLINDKIGEDND